LQNKNIKEGKTNMAIETKEYEKVIKFINDVGVKELFIPNAELPEIFTKLHGWIGSGFEGEYKRYIDTGEWATRTYQIFVSGWTEIEGVMIINEEDELDADIRVSITAKNERALRDLLASFPRGKVGFIYTAGEWTLNTISEFLDGYIMPSRECYFASNNTFKGKEYAPVKKVGHDDYHLVSSQWGREVWEDVKKEGFNVYTCHKDEELKALCFHWQVWNGRNEVHGLQAYGEHINEYAESVFSVATKAVLDMGKIATCTANLSNDYEFLEMIKRIGYKLYYRIQSFIGIKKGSGSIGNLDPATYFKNLGQYKNKQFINKVNNLTVINHLITEKKDPVISEFKDLDSLKGRIEQSKFVVEGSLLVKRALYDGLPVDKILYTSNFTKGIEGLEILKTAYMSGISHYKISDGLMGAVTQTRPLPVVIASVYNIIRGLQDFHLSDKSALLITDCVSNPDNLGMILRTADASGIDGVIVMGNGANVFHKNCIRASRGTVGRIPILGCCSDFDLLHKLKVMGFNIVGASAKASGDLYNLPFNSSLAFIVGNESNGVRKEVLDYCTETVRIPMAPGQSSLNVGVATGLLLYELVRHRLRGSL
jgi:tRNA G18 (ribose-2'-O)-methylase SpoU